MNRNSLLAFGWLPSWLSLKIWFGIFLLVILLVDTSL